MSENALFSSSKQLEELIPEAVDRPVWFEQSAPVYSFVECYVCELCLLLKQRQVSINKGVTGCLNY